VKQPGEKRGINLPLESTFSHVAKSKGLGEKGKKEIVEEEIVEGGGVEQESNKISPLEEEL